MPPCVVVSDVFGIMARVATAAAVAVGGVGVEVVFLPCADETTTSVCLERGIGLYADVDALAFGAVTNDPDTSLLLLL